MLTIDFKNALEGTADNFTCMLFRLMLKADRFNLAKLEEVYPEEAKIVKAYKTGEYLVNKSIDLRV